MATTKPNIAALIEQMPDTDKEVQAKQKAAPEKPDQQPNAATPDKPAQASTFTGPNPEAAEKIYAEVLSGGRDSLIELLALLHDPADSDFKNYKAGYLLHGLAIYLGRPDQQKERRMFAETLASQLGNPKYSKPVQGVLIRELQVAGGKEVASALGKQLQDDELCEYATQALLAIGDGAGVQLRKALGKATGKNRLTLIQALGVVRDTDSLAELKKALAEPEGDVRIATAWALANIGDAGALEAVIKSADAAEGWERIQTTKACLLLAERLLARGKKGDAVRLYTRLSETRKDPAERYVREAADKALGAPQIKAGAAPQL